MPKYLVLIYGDEQRWEAMTEREQAEIDAGHREFQRAAAGRVLASGELEPASTATSLRAGPDRPTATDGPFLETKEVLGGFYLLEAANRDEAVALAGGLAEASHDHSGVELRPLVEHG